MGKKYKKEVEIGSNKPVRNNTFLLVFFGFIILLQFSLIAFSGFKARPGQLIGIGIGLIGYIIIALSSVKPKGNKKK